jgi:uncharacterized paraquat-inducible protein A
MASKDELDEVGFVICSQCGAHIRADRLRCLRCRERLVPYKQPSLPLPAWLEALGGGTLIFATVFSFVVVVIIMTLLS